MADENYTPIGFEGIYAPEPMVGPLLDPVTSEPIVPPLEPPFIEAPPPQERGNSQGTPDIPDRYSQEASIDKFLYESGKAKVSTTQDLPDLSQELQDFREQQQLQSQQEAQEKARQETVQDFVAQQQRQAEIEQRGVSTRPLPPSPFDQQKPPLPATMKPSGEDDSLVAIMVKPSETPKLEPTGPEWKGKSTDWLFKNGYVNEAGVATQKAEQNGFAQRGDTVMYTQMTIIPGWNVYQGSLTEEYKDKIRPDKYDTTTLEGWLSLRSDYRAPTKDDKGPLLTKYGDPEIMALMKPIDNPWLTAQDEQYIESSRDYSLGYILPAELFRKLASLSATGGLNKPITIRDNTGKTTEISIASLINSSIGNNWGVTSPMDFARKYMDWRDYGQYFIPRDKQFTELASIKSWIDSQKNIIPKAAYDDLMSYYAKEVTSACTSGQCGKGVVSLYDDIKKDANYESWLNRGWTFKSDPGDKDYPISSIKPEPKPEPKPERVTSIYGETIQVAGRPREPKFTVAQRLLDLLTLTTPVLGAIPQDAWDINKSVKNLGGTDKEITYLTWNHQGKSYGLAYDSQGNAVGYSRDAKNNVWEYPKGIDPENPANSIECTNDECKFDQAEISASHIFAVSNIIPQIPVAPKESSTTIRPMPPPESGAWEQKLYYTGDVSKVNPNYFATSGQEISAAQIKELINKHDVVIIEYGDLVGCGPCQMARSRLIYDLANKYKDADVALIQVNGTLSNMSALEKLAKEVDPSASFNSVPYSIITKKGTIEYKGNPFSGEEKLSSLIPKSEVSIPEPTPEPVKPIVVIEEAIGYLDMSKFKGNEDGQVSNIYVSPIDAKGNVTFRFTTKEPTIGQVMYCIGGAGCMSTPAEKRATTNHIITTTIDNFNPLQTYKFSAVNVKAGGNESIVTPSADMPMLQMKEGKIERGVEVARGIKIEPEVIAPVIATVPAEEYKPIGFEGIYAPTPISSEPEVIITKADVPVIAEIQTNVEQKINELSSLLKQKQSALETEGTVKQAIETELLKESMTPEEYAKEILTIGMVKTKGDIDEIKLDYWKQKKEYQDQGSDIALTEDEYVAKVLDSQQTLAETGMMFVPFEYTRPERWETVQTWEKVVYPALDILMFVPLIGWAGKGISWLSKSTTSGAKIAALGGKQSLKFSAEQAIKSVADAGTKLQAKRDIANTIEKQVTKALPSERSIYEDALKAAQKDLSIGEKEFNQITKQSDELQKLLKESDAYKGSTSYEVGRQLERRTAGVGKYTFPIADVGTSGAIVAATVMNWGELTPTQRAAGLTLASLPLGLPGKAFNYIESAIIPSKIPRSALEGRKISSEVKKGELFQSKDLGTVRLVLDDTIGTPEQARIAVSDLVDQLSKGNDLAVSQYGDKQIVYRGTGFQSTIGDGTATLLTATPQGDIFRKGTGQFGTKTNLETYIQKLRDKNIQLDIAGIDVRPGVVVVGKEGGIYLAPSSYTKFATQSAFGVKGKMPSVIILSVNDISKLPPAIAKELLDAMEKKALKTIGSGEYANQVMEGFKQYRQFMEAEAIATNQTELIRVQNLRSKLADKLNMNLGEYYTRTPQGRIELLQMRIEGGRTTPYTLKELYTLKGKALQNTLEDIFWGLRQKIDELKAPKEPSISKGEVPQEFNVVKEKQLNKVLDNIDNELKQNRITETQAIKAKYEAINSYRRNAELRTPREIIRQDLRRFADEPTARILWRDRDEVFAERAGRIDDGRQPIRTVETLRSDYLPYRLPRIEDRKDIRILPEERIIPRQPMRPETREDIRVPREDVRLPIRLPVDPRITPRIAPRLGTYRGGKLTAQEQYNQLSQEQKNGIIAWKQGWIYILKYPPYEQVNTIHSKNPIPGVKISSGPKSAYESIAKLEGSYLPPRIQHNLGIFKVDIAGAGNEQPKLMYDLQEDEVALSKAEADAEREAEKILEDQRIAQELRQSTNITQLDIDKLIQNRYKLSRNKTRLPSGMPQVTGTG